MSHIYQDKKFKKKQEKNWHELSIKMCEKSNRSYNVAVLCRSSKLFCRSSQQGRTDISCQGNRRFMLFNFTYVQKSRLHMKLKSFPPFGTKLWNCLHPDWRKLTKRAFKRKIHKLLLTLLEIEDDYVDAHSLILNFKNTRIELS